MADRLWLDIETFSEADLRKAGVYRYTEDPTFEVLMAAWSTGGEVRVAFGDEIPRIPGLADPNVLKTAHNAAFERVCMSRVLGLPTGEYLPPEQWRDTMALAGEYGLPRGLDALARELGAAPKDSAGTRLINLFSKPRRDGSRTMPWDAPDAWLDFVAYCAQDVRTLMEVDAKLGSWPTVEERRLYHVDQRINDRGMRVDVDLARHATRAGARTTAQQRARLVELTGVDNPGSVQQLSAWFARTGRPVPDLRADTVRSMLTEPDLGEQHREVLTIRSDLALSAPKKFQAAMDAVSGDGRLRGTLRFFGAHTGRWAGRLANPQNLPRAGFNAAEERLAVAALKAGGEADAETLKKLVRAMFDGPLTVVDYASIEARVVAWLAGEQWALDAFAGGRDIYVETAERMSTPGNQLTRQQGKVAVLALGYGGSVNALRVMGADGSDGQLQTMVHRWRAANPRINRLWYAVEEAFVDGGRAGARIAVYRRGADRRLLLPSGRSIAYRKTRNTTFQDPRGFRVETWGGRIVENLTQAVARDVLAHALVNLDALGYRVVGHVHDEVIVEGEHDVDEVAAVMTAPPPWADGLPLAAEGFVCERYRKG